MYIVFTSFSPSPSAGHQLKIPRRFSNYWLAENGVKLLETEATAEHPIHCWQFGSANS
jgi:hypothetical protein